MQASKIPRNCEINFLAPIKAKKTTFTFQILHIFIRAAPPRHPTEGEGKKDKDKKKERNIIVFIGQKWEQRKV